MDRGSVMANGHPVLLEVLKAAAPRPDDASLPKERIAYAVRFADAMALRIASDLSARLEGIEATTKRSAGSLRGPKQLDVNFSTPQMGLALGISLKSVHLRDSGGAARYTHNMKRNEEELRIEASGYHKRQPYAVMVGVLFLPFDSCSDGKKDNPSSFGSFVRHLRPYCGRLGPQDDADKFERLFVGLYALDGSDLRFFDIQLAPPKNGKPINLASYSQFLDETYHAFLSRNAADFKWAEGESDPLHVAELPSP
jgi:hypothetical protein